MTAGEAEAASAVRPFNGPHHRLFATAVRDDMAVWTRRIYVRPVANLIGRRGHKDWSDSRHRGFKADVEIPFVAIAERLDATRDRVVARKLLVVRRPHRV